MRGGFPSCLPNNTDVPFFLYIDSLKRREGSEETGKGGDLDDVFEVFSFL